MDTDENIEMTYVIVNVYHKLRGGKGIWKQIEPGELIRVTKHIGKKVKMNVSSSIMFNQNDLSIKLVDLVRPEFSEDNSRFVVENVFFRDNEYNGKDADYEMKIFTLSKRLEFHVEIRTKQGIFRQKSVCFGSHNSGKHRLGKRPPVPPGPKLVLIRYDEGNPLVKNEEQTEDSYFPPSQKKPRVNSEGIFQDLRLHISTDIFLDQLNACCMKNGTMYSWQAIARNPLSIIAEEIRRVFPEIVKCGQFLYTAYYQDLIPVILYNLNLNIQLDREIVLPEDILRFNYSLEELRNLAVTTFGSIRQKTMVSAPIKNMDDLEEMKQFLEKNVLHQSDLLDKNIAVGVYPKYEPYHYPQLFLAIYKEQDLLLQEPLTLNQFCPLFLDAPQNITEPQHFTVSIYSLTEVPLISGYAALYDLRGNTPEQTIIILSPHLLEGSKYLYLVGSFYLHQDKITWASNQNYTQP
eukprot:TRINITY_DN10552_c0_g1_i1.p1 TRINITY_DN10552_c0_g1~~TRINITY_DN10552_c0_g1_i1.p1  ORF type:complete len:463 (+),score=91.85 TRINITY_DN10552_c0_g1_i1:31-1419(+)